MNDRKGGFLSGDERIRLFGADAFWPYSHREFDAIAALLQQPTSENSLDHVLQAAKAYVVNRHQLADVKPNRRDEIARVGAAVDELLRALEGVSIDARMCFFAGTQGKSDDIFELRRAAEAFANRHRDLLSSPPPIPKGGQSFKYEERQLILQIRAAYRSAYPTKRNPQGFWNFFNAVTAPLRSFGLGAALAGEDTDPATWRSAWEKIEQRSVRAPADKPRAAKRLRKTRT